MSTSKRWYDADPTLSLAISLIKNANEHDQLKCSEYIINKAKNLGVSNRENSLNGAFNYILRRWYDNDKQISEAFEYLRCASAELQKEISLEVIELLQELQ